jgi:molecular chaperone DnaK
MSKDDIEKAVRDAEQFAAEDKKRREEIDTRNNADQMVYQCEKTLNELGDKVSGQEKADVEAKLGDLKEALKGTDIDAIKAKQEALQQAFYAVSQKVYEAAQAAQQAQAGAQGAGAQQAPGADYVDADYVDADDNN